MKQIFDKNDSCLKITQTVGLEGNKIIKFENISDFVIEISYKPKHPKRKINSFTVIPPNEFIILDSWFKFNLEDCYFRFFKEKK